MKKKRLILMPILLVAVFIFLICCSEDSPGETGDDFDRKSMLQNWADNTIIPGYKNYVSRLSNLSASVNIFNSSPTPESLNSLRNDWLEAYIAWQYIGMFEIGKAEELTLINYTNIYPTNTTELIQTIKSGDYNLTAVNKQNEQGFPAIDYLINGLDDTDRGIVNVYLHESNGQLYKTYLSDLSGRLEAMARSVLNDWQNGYRDNFINNDGSDATSSVNKLVNDYLFYYEKHLRAGKIGIPAGVFSNAPLSDQVEALYGGNSKVLFMAGLDAMQKIFNGMHFDGRNNGDGLRDYLDFVNSVKEGEDLGALIDKQFSQTKIHAEKLNDDFSIQVETDNTEMLKTYDELQKNIVLMKVDMLQALNIKVDFVDADGD